MISFHKRISYSVSAILTQCTYTITTYLLKPINYCTINKGSILLYSKRNDRWNSNRRHSFFIL